MLFILKEVHYLFCLKILYSDMIHLNLKHAGYITVAILFAACGNNANDELAHHHHDHGGSHEGHDHESEGHDHDSEKAEGEGHEGIHEIILEPAQAQRFGVTTAKVAAGPFNNVIKVSGQIIDAPESAGVIVAPTSGVVNFVPGIAVGKQLSRGARIATVRPTAVTGGDPNAAARAAINAAQREVNRLKPLHERGIVSTSEYNRALAALETARAQYSPAAASGAATAPIAGTITQLLVNQGQYVDAGTPIASLSGAGKLTLRADLPQKYYSQAASVSGVKIKLPYSSEVLNLEKLGAKRSTSNQLVSSTPGYLPIYFTFNNNGTLIPGTFVEAYLLGDTRNNVISVPVSALSEQQGDYFVYVKIDEEGYVKTPVTPGQRDGELVEIVSGLKPGDEVVVTGTTTVRLAETSNVVPEGHTHNH